MTSTNTTDRPMPAVGDILSCGHARPATDGLGTGYAYDVNGATMCYPCADASELSALLATETTRFLAYVSSSGDLTTWSGGLLARGIPHKHGVSRNGWHGSPIHSWRFRDETGAEWFGRNGGHGMCILVRRAKMPPAPVTVSGDVVSVDHVGSSYWGNPRYRITLADGRSYRTAPDAGVSYSAPNYRRHSLRLPVSSVVMTLDGRGNVVDIRRPDGSEA